MLGHELNNSLAPIKSIAGSLETLVKRDPLPGDWREDTSRGLSIIATRSEGLSRFMGAYARLAKLPRPQLAPVDVGAWIRNVVSLEQRIHAELIPGPEFTIQRRSRPVGATADQPAAQRGRRVARNRRRRDDRRGTRCSAWRCWKVLIAGRRPRPFEHLKPVRAVLHHQARGVRHRAGAEPADRGSARRVARPAQSPNGPGCEARLIFPA